MTESMCEWMKECDDDDDGNGNDDTHWAAEVNQKKRLWKGLKREKERG